MMSQLCGESHQILESLMIMLLEESTIFQMDKKNLDGLIPSVGLTPELMTTKSFFKLIRDKV